jgi:hypothetical protein
MDQLNIPAELPTSIWATELLSVNVMTGAAPQLRNDRKHRHENERRKTAPNQRQMCFPPPLFAQSFRSRFVMIITHQFWVATILYSRFRHVWPTHSIHPAQIHTESACLVCAEALPLDSACP